jgi:hypothetical protein
MVLCTMGDRKQLSRRSSTRVQRRRLSSLDGVVELEPRSDTNVQQRGVFKLRRVWAHECPL